MHHGRSNQYSFLYHDKKIVLHPMSPEAVMQDDVSRTKKIKSEEHAKVENKNNAKSVFDPKREITSKRKCMLATKFDIHELAASKTVVYALVCKDALISLHDVQHSLPPTAVNILQEYTDVFPSEVPQGLPPTLRDRAPD